MQPDKRSTRAEESRKSKFAHGSLTLILNGIVSVFIQGDLDANSTKAFSLTTVLNLNFADTLQLVCQNITAGTNASGFRAVSLNASLIEI